MIRLGLRVRLTVAVVALLAVGLVAGAAVLLAVTRHTLVSGLDGRARQQARDVAALVAEARLPDPVPVADVTATVQVLDGTGTVRATSAGGERLVPLVDTRALPAVRNGSAVTVDASVVGGSGPLRIVGAAADGPQGAWTVLVAVPAGEAEGGVRAVRTATLVTIPVLLLVVGAGTWWTVGAALAPVEALRRRAQQISEARGDERLPVPEGSDEVRRLAETLNAMLARLASSQERTRAFVADAAHELRSPLASLRVQLEVAVRCREDELLRGALVDVDRLARLTDDLLLLARLDDARAGGQAARCDAVAVVRDVGRRWPQIELSAAGQAWCGAPEAEVARIVTNLAENAVRHARRTVTIGVRGEGSDVLLEVADDGPGIGEADRQRVFERFTRLDAGRDRDSGGSGLGLAIVRGLARSRGGEVWLEEAAPGLRAVVRLPRA